MQKTNRNTKKLTVAKKKHKRHKKSTTYSFYLRKSTFLQFAEDECIIHSHFKRIYIQLQHTTSL